VAEAAVALGVGEEKDGSMTIKRAAGADYAVSYEPATLAAIGGKTRTMPAAFIAPSGSDVTQAYLDYLRPLLGSEVPIRARLQAHRVPKLLNK